MERQYQIRVKGQLDPSLSAWFGDYTATHTPDGDTLLAGTVIDQAALHGVFARCRDLGLSIISVNPLDAAQAAKQDGAKTMYLFHVEASEIIDARAEDLYAIVRDYRVGHPAILPKPYFTELSVEKGGVGAGSVILVRLEAFGKKYTYHQLVSEPEPGRRILEANMDDPGSTTFTFEPLDGGRRTRVTIATEMVGRARALAFLEKLMTKSFAQRLYKQELRNLGEYVHSKVAVAIA